MNGNFPPMELLFLLFWISFQCLQQQQQNFLIQFHTLTPQQHLQKNWHDYLHQQNCEWVILCLQILYHITGSSTGAQNKGRGGFFKIWLGWEAWVNTWGSMGGLKVLKNTCEGVYFLVKLTAITLEACKFTRNELLHAKFSMILGRF